MKYRNCLAILLVSAAVACTRGSDNPSGPLGLTPRALVEDGVKPPPPAGSEDVDITISFDGVSRMATAASATPAGIPPFPGFFARLTGRYFANTQDTNGWLDFESRGVTGQVGSTIASIGARLSYNDKRDRTNGRGTLSVFASGGIIVVLDLSKINITGGSFGSCPTDFSDDSCADVAFTYDLGDDVLLTGTLIVRPAFRGEG